MTAQLEAMRAQLRDSEQQRLQQSEAPPDAPPEPARVPEPDNQLFPDELPPELVAWIGEDGDIDAQAILDRLKAGAGRWLEGLDEDLKGVRPSTLLLVFGLGVMVGKMTA